MTNYVKCQLLNRTVEFKSLSSGYISVGVDGTLVGNYPTVNRAMFEAAEHVRVLENQSMRPNLSEATWAAVEALAWVQQVAAENVATVVEVTVTVGHRSGIAGARWCLPVGWSPRNRVEGADWSDEDGCWQDADGDAAGLVVFTEDDEDEGETVTVGLDDIRVVSCGECRVIGEVQVDFA
jgi:hypothetical protein